MEDFIGESVLSVFLNVVLDKSAAFAIASEMIAYSRLLGILNRLTDVRFTIRLCW